MSIGLLVAQPLHFNTLALANSLVRHPCLILEQLDVIDFTLLVLLRGGPRLRRLFGSFS